MRVCGTKTLAPTALLPPDTLLDWCWIEFDFEPCMMNSSFRDWPPFMSICGERYVAGLTSLINWLGCTLEFFLFISRSIMMTCGSRVRRSRLVSFINTALFGVTGLLWWPYLTTSMGSRLLKILLRLCSSRGPTFGSDGLPLLLPMFLITSMSRFSWSLFTWSVDAIDAPSHAIGFKVWGT